MSPRIYARPGPVSQNGWGVLSTTSTLLRPWTIGPVTLTGRTGAAGFVLGHYALWYHEEIERLWPHDMPDHDDHWHGMRQIGGTNVWSNHASATAIDLNAARHPQGTEPEQTFTSVQCRRIRTKMDDKYPVLKWGGDFNTTPDPMHVEIRDLDEASKAEVRELALQLVPTPIGKRLIAAQAKPVKWEKW